MRNNSREGAGGRGKGGAANCERSRRNHACTLCAYINTIQSGEHAVYINGKRARIRAECVHGGLPRGRGVVGQPNGRGL